MCAWNEAFFNFLFSTCLCVYVVNFICLIKDGLSSASTS